MKNFLAILVALALFSVSTTVFAGEGPLALPKGADDKAKTENVKGITHWQKGDYKVALKHFSAASQAYGSSGQIHFNEAISYDKVGKHGVATKHFGVALKKAGGNPQILNSPILKGHLGM